MLHDRRKMVDTRDVSLDKRGIEEFPHIIKNISDMWSTITLEEYFKRILFDRSNKSRQGFPPHAFSDLTFLYDLYIEIMSTHYRPETDIRNHTEREIVDHIKEQEDYHSWQGLETSKHPFVD